MTSSQGGSTHHLLGSVGNERAPLVEFGEIERVHVLQGNLLVGLLVQTAVQVQHSPHDHHLRVHARARPERTALATCLRR